MYFNQPIDPFRMQFLKWNNWKHQRLDKILNLNSKWNIFCITFFIFRSLKYHIKIPLRILPFEEIWRRLEDNRKIVRIQFVNLFWSIFALKPYKFTTLLNVLLNWSKRTHETPPIFQLFSILSILFRLSSSDKTRDSSNS